MLSCLSVRIDPVACLRLWRSSRYLRISPLHLEFRQPLSSSRTAVCQAVPQLSCGISQSTGGPAYAPFKPSDSALRSGPSYYRGCWHEVSRTFLFGYSHFLPRRKSFTTQRPSSLTRHRCIRVSPIVQDSPLLPPVGVWAVSQSQCGWSSSKNSY